MAALVGLGGPFGMLVGAGMAGTRVDAGQPAGEQHLAGLIRDSVTATRQDVAVSVDGRIRRLKPELVIALEDHLRTRDLGDPEAAERGQGRRRPGREGRPDCQQRAAEARAQTRYRCSGARAGECPAEDHLAQVGMTSAQTSAAASGPGGG